MHCFPFSLAVGEGSIFSTSLIVLTVCVLIASYWLWSGISFLDLIFLECPIWHHIYLVTWQLCKLLSFTSVSLLKNWGWERLGNWPWTSQVVCWGLVAHPVSRLQELLCPFSFTTLLQVLHVGFCLWWKEDLPQSTGNTGEGGVNSNLVCGCLHMGSSVCISLWRTYKTLTEKWAGREYSVEGTVGTKARWQEVWGKLKNFEC